MSSRTRQEGRHRYHKMQRSFEIHNVKSYYRFFIMSILVNNEDSQRNIQQGTLFFTYRYLFYLSLPPSGLLLPLSFRTWSLDGHRLEGKVSRHQSTLDYPSSPPQMTYEEWKHGGAWDHRTGIIANEQQRQIETASMTSNTTNENIYVNVDQDHSEGKQSADPWQNGSPSRWAIEKVAAHVTEEAESVDLSDLKVSAFNGRTDDLHTQRIAGGVVVPTHTYKTIICWGRRRKPKGNSSKNDNFPNSRPPRFMMEAFLIPNSVIPIPLPLKAFSIPIGPLERLAGLNLNQFISAGSRYSLMYKRPSITHQLQPHWDYLAKLRSHWNRSQAFLNDGDSGSRMVSDGWSKAKQKQLEAWDRMMAKWWKESHIQADKLGKKGPANIKHRVLHMIRKDRSDFDRQESSSRTIPLITDHYGLEYTEEQAGRLSRCSGQAIVMWSQSRFGRSSPAAQAIVSEFRRADQSNNSPNSIEKCLLAPFWNHLDAPWAPIEAARKKTIWGMRYPKTKRTNGGAMTYSLPIVADALPPWMK